MFHPETPDEERIEQVILQSVRRILENEDADGFLAWAGETIPQALALTDEGLTPEEAQRLAMLLATSIWNATPLPSEGFRPRPLSPSAGDGACPCGSGRPQRDCCGPAEEAPELSADLIWELLLDELPERQLKQAVAEGAVPPHLLGAVADRWLGEDRPGRAVSLLEPLFDHDLAELDARFDPALNVLCDAYDRLDHWKKKREFLERMTGQGSRALRAAAWQRLSTIHIDDGDFARAAEAFTEALRLDPDSPGLAVLEITLLAAQHEDGLARQRAGFWRRKLTRQGLGDEEIVAFLRRAEEDPQDALMASQAAIIDPLLTGLRDWMRAAEAREVPEYRLEACGGRLDPVPAGQLSLFGDNDAAGGVRAEDITARAVRLRPSQALRRLEAQWHQVFPAPKPHATRLMPLFEGDLWGEDAWVRFLLKHPEAADSLDILDDLATALYLHPESSLPWVARALLVPVLERGRRILEHSLHDHPDRVLPWAVPDNRPPLRLLFRLFLFREEGGYEHQAAAILETLLRLNPDDNHGLRAELMNHYLRRGEDENALELSARFPGDALADLAYGEVLALYRLGRRENAARALSEAVCRLPRIPHYLTRKRVRQPPLSPTGVSAGGDDQAWLYREAMRDVWEAEPGVLAWLKKHMA